MTVNLDLLFQHYSWFIQHPIIPKIMLAYCASPLSVVSYLRIISLLRRPSASGDIERDGHLKPLLKLASTFGADVAPDGPADFTEELEKQIVILRIIIDDIRKRFQSKSQRNGNYTK